MKFNLTYGPDIASAPDGFKATVEAVAAFFESTFTDPVTINVKVERGLSGGLLGHSDYTLTGPYTFAQITTALAQDRKAAATPSPSSASRPRIPSPGPMPIT
jgi:hypothetical protein